MSQIELSSYLEAVSRACRRGRAVLALLILATVLHFLAFWNTLPVSWMAARVSTLQNAVEWVEKKPDLGRLTDEEREAFNNAQDYFELANHPDAQRLRDDLAAVMEIRNTRVAVIAVPILGIIVDVNDLSVIGGFALFVLLLWFRYALQRERSNVHVAMTVAKERDDLRDAFQVLAMDQVLTVPEIEPDKDSPSWLEANLPRFLFPLPLISQCAAYIFDLTSYKVGLVLSVHAMIISYAVGGFVTAAVAILTFQCIGISLAIDREWKKWTSELEKSPRPAA